MLQKVKKYIETNKLLQKSGLHIIALSGGADSVCLLRMMLNLDYRIHAVHCNFHLRGKESDRDERFCQQLCNELQVPLHITHFETQTYAESHKVSIEMAARELRYNYFEQLRTTLKAETILVAHHCDDSVETMLMNLLRGTGIRGLEGIRPRNGHIIRPLLCLHRSEIIDYLTVISQNYVTDSSNLLDNVIRNKIRLNLIPILESINPAAIKNISRTIKNVTEAVKVVDFYTNNSIKDCISQTKGNIISINKQSIKNQPSPELTLYFILTKYNFSPQQITQIYENIDAIPGKLWESYTHILASDRETLIIDSKEDGNNDSIIRIPEPGTYLYKKGISIKIETTKRENNFLPSKERYNVTLDADKIHFPITMRRTLQGDRFSPFGMKGSKLVSDYLTNKKFNYFQRKHQLVIEDANGEIIWLIGERTSQQASCDDNTINVLTLRYIDKHMP